MAEPPIFLTLCGLLVADGSLRAADLYDAPGRGYLEQAEKVRQEPNRQRSVEAYRKQRSKVFELAKRRGYILENEQQSRRNNVEPDPAMLTSEVRRLNQTLPELPTENPFERPMRLFGR